MATNPVFNRIDKEMASYAGFNAQQHAGAPQGHPQQGYPQQAPRQQGYPQQSYSQQGYSQQAPGHQGGTSLSPEQLEQMYRQPPAGPAQTGRVTLDDVVMKALMLFGIVVIVAVGAWMFIAGKDTPQLQASTAMPIWLGGMFGSLALSFVIAFSKKVNVPLIVVHAVLQGAFIGAVSQTFEQAWPGVVGTAVLATMGTFTGMFVAWKAGFIKVTSKTRRVFGMVTMGYLVFLLLNLGASWMGFGDGWGIYGGPLGILVSLLGVGLASYSLAVSFDSVDRAVRGGAPEKYSWLLGHGLVASLVWLYIEFLRLFAILSRN